MLRPHAVRAARGALIRQALPHFAVCRRGVAVSAQGRHRTPCGAVGAVHNEGDVVTVYGWVERTRNFGGLLFVTLRDSSGAVQLVLPDEASEALAHRAAHLRSESVVEVRGVLRRRPEDMVNPRMRTGAVELVLEEVAEMNPCDGAVPIPVRAEAHVSEELRLQHRHIDLRRPAMQRNLFVRGKVVAALRRELEEAHHFLDVETPALFKSTPEGAREFVVATRQAGHFYALPQSPQQFKQLLMVGGVERYYQVARCFRDESGRADRQPEFTQLDLEMAFPGPDDVRRITECVVGRMWEAGAAAVAACHSAAADAAALAPDASALGPAPAVSPPPAEGIPVITYAEAMRRFGSDKPDLRCAGCCPLDADRNCPHSSGPSLEGELVDASGVVRACGSRQLADAANAPTGGAAALRCPALGALSRKQGQRQLQELGIADQATVLRVGSACALRGPMAKFFPAPLAADLCSATGAREGDAVLVAAGSGWAPHEALGRARAALAQPREDAPAHCFLWVTDFPLFERDAKGGAFAALPLLSGPPHALHTALASTHHPFVAPHPADAPALARALEEADRGDGSADEEALLALRGASYDIICNGVELGGGSHRIHDSALQDRVLRLALRVPADRMHVFGHLLTALGQGAPPHGGIALGVDRALAVLLGAPSVRDVIAFPKSATGRDLMTGAPAPLLAAQLQEYHLGRARE